MPSLSEVFRGAFQSHVALWRGGIMEELPTDKLLFKPKEETVFDELKPINGPLVTTNGDGMTLGDKACNVLNDPDPFWIQEMEIVLEYESTVKPVVVAAPSVTTIPNSNTNSSQDMITYVQALYRK